MKWGISDVKHMEQWNLGLKLLEYYPIYSKTAISHSWGVTARFLMKISDFFSMINMNHMKFY
jgi:hypothetical protein